MKNPFLERALDSLTPEKQRDLMLAFDYERRQFIDDIARDLGLIIIPYEQYNDLRKLKVSP